MTNRQSAHTRRFRGAAVALWAAAPLVTALGWALNDLAEYNLVSGFVFIGGLTCASLGGMLWTRSDPIHDRSRYRPGGDLWLDPNESNHAPGT